MNFFKRPFVAVLLSALIVLCSTLVSINVKLESKCDAVSDIFYEGVRISGVDYPAMAEPMKQLCALTDDVILIAVNFSDQAFSNVEINLPDLALGLYGIRQGVKDATDLLSGSKTRKTVSAEKPFTLSLAPWGAALWKFSAAKNAPARSSKTAGKEKVSASPEINTAKKGRKTANK